MQILIPDSWLHDFLKTSASPKQIQEALSLCGPSVERLHHLGKDFVYDVEVTTNRVDLMSVMGLAREASAILPQFGYSAKFLPPHLAALINGPTPGLSIDLNPDLCRRVLALKVDHLKVEPSPQWLQDRLLAVGQRPLNNLVDITNYVMWEIGHPTHVFDFDRLTTGKMLIREAKKGETITTLDDKTYTLVGGEVVIDNGKGEIIDLPSIIGTANSVVTPETASALFFIDDVEPRRVRLASMTHAIRTQAATLMEKGVDPELGPIALARTAALINQIAPHAKVGFLTDIYPEPSPSVRITISAARIAQLMGVAIPQPTISHILTSLGCDVKLKKTVFTVIPPSWRRSDLTIPEDIVEEIARIHGYFRLPSQLMAGQLPQHLNDPAFYWERRIKYALMHWGFTETYTYSLVSSQLESHPQALSLKNPLSAEWQYLRTSLIPSHLSVLQTNVGRVGEINLFEIANVYLPRPKDLPDEQLHLILSTTNSDPYCLKGLVSSLLDELGLPSEPFQITGREGFLFCEINLVPLIPRASYVRPYTPISLFSPIIEDYNLTLNRSYADLEKAIFAASPLISSVEVVDKYQNRITVRVTYHHKSKQLTTDDIAPLRSKIENLN